jgi:hypothetical protein
MGLFRRRLRTLVAIASMVLGLGGCESPAEPVVCTTIAVQAITLTVVDGTSGQRVCDATVTVVDGSFSQVLPPFPGSATECTYSGPTERAGTYEVRVSRAGYQPATERNVRVTADVCHVNPVRLTMTLSRTS